MPDKWSQYEVPASGADKWEQYAEKPSNRPAGLPAGVDLPGVTAHPAVTMRGGITGNLETIPTNEAEPGILGGVKAGVHNFGARVANNAIGLAKPWANPIDSILSHPGYSDPSKMTGAIDTIRNAPDKLVGVENAAGDIATAGLLGKVVEQVPKIPLPTVRNVGRLGEVLQNAGSSLLNSKFSPTMKETIRGNDPGRGMLEAGIGPTLTKGSLANKVSGATEAVGSGIGNAVTRADQNALAPPILSREIAPAITSPINEAVSHLNGPFGTASTAPYETMTAKLGNTAPEATAPIYGPDAPSEILPSDLWKHIKNLDKNTRFNTDPEVESVNETRRDIRQGLRPHLEASDPTIAPLSRTYGDLLSAQDAISRTQGGFGVPKGVASLIDSTIKSTPVVTTGATGLFRVGRGLKSLSTNAPQWMGGQGGAPPTLPFQPRTSPFIASPRLLPSETVGNQGGAEYSQGGFPGRPSVVTPAPGSPLRLPSNTNAGEAQPMVAIKSSQPASVPEQYARTRVVPTKGELRRIGGTTLPPEHQGLSLPSGSTLLRLPSSTTPGEVQTMVGILNDYPELASGFAREKTPTIFSPKESIPSGKFTVDQDGNVVPSRLQLKAPPKKSR